MANADGVGMVQPLHVRRADADRQVRLTKALQAEQVARISILNYTGLLYAFAFGTVLFGERYNRQALGGMLLVVLGVLLSVLYSRRKRVIPAGAPA